MKQAVFIFMWWHLAAASYYFHELSRVNIKPNPKTDHYTFGFSLGYQSGKRNLVAGAPHSDLIGKVFECPLDNVFVNQTYCDDINIDFATLAPYDREYVPNLKFNLGVSVAAASDYFLTCAPLWTTAPAGGMRNFSYGTCFTYNGTVHRYNGMLEQHQLHPGSVKPYYIMTGGNGWRTLMDEDNEMLLIAKVSLTGNIGYLNSSRPLDPVTSLISNSLETHKRKVKQYLKQYRQLGFSMTAGKFFDNRTMYAVSASSTTKDTVHFLYSQESTKSKNVKILDMLKDDNYIYISDDSMGSMFGAALGSADMNNDGLSELLVGAPVQDDGDEGLETGALHIYLGGDKSTVHEASRHRVIVHSKDGARFGTAIAASDVDGDTYPEIFVSAPYEDMGVGALYILSGYEVHNLVIGDERIERTPLAKLKKTQRISFKESKTFGYSLQIIPDMTDNGCKELAVGAPETNEIILLRCIPAVNVTVTASLVGAQIVKEQDTEFTVNVCISVKHLKGRNFSIELRTTNEIIGNRVSIEAHQRSFSLVLSNSEETKCHDVVVNLNEIEAGEYRFSTKVEMDKNKIIKSDKFSSSWVMISPQSLTETSFDVSRHCSGKDCDPNLNATIIWAESDDTYELGSSDTLEATLRVDNKGNSSFEACVVLRIKGAPVLRVSCGDNLDGYKCYMPKPLRRNAFHEVPIVFNMSQPSSDQKELTIQASIYELCNQPNLSKNFTWTLPFKVDTDRVSIKDVSHNQIVTDVEIEDVRDRTISNVHEYWVINKGSITWTNVTVKVWIAMEKKPYIESYRVSWPDCSEVVTTNQYKLCKFDLKPKIAIKIIVTSVILKEKIIENVKDGKLELNSTLSLTLLSATEKIKKESNLSSVITYQKEKTLGQNMELIIFLAILGALIGLGLVVFILYKLEFFKRKEKTMLEVLKQEHIRRQSVKRSMSTATNHEEGGLDMEVDDDCAFEIVDINDPILNHESNVSDTKL